MKSCSCKKKIQSLLDELDTFKLPILGGYINGYKKGIKACQAKLEEPNPSPDNDSGDKP